MDGPPTAERFIRPGHQFEGHLGQTFWVAFTWTLLSIVRPEPLRYSLPLKPPLHALTAPNGGLKGFP